VRKYGITGGEDMRGIKMRRKNGFGFHMRFKPVPGSDNDK